MSSPSAKPTEFSIGRVLAVALPFVLIAGGIVAYTRFGVGGSGAGTYTIDDLVPVVVKVEFRGAPLAQAEVRAHGADGEPIAIAITDSEGVANLETDIGNGVLAMGVFKKELRLTVSARLPGTGTPGPEYTPEPYRTKEATPLIVDFSQKSPGDVLEFTLEDDGTAMTQEAIDEHLARAAEGQANAAEMSAARERQNAGGGGGGPGGGGRRGGQRSEGEGAQGPGDGGQEGAGESQGNESGEGESSEAGASEAGASEATSESEASAPEPPATTEPESGNSGDGN